MAKVGNKPRRSVPQHVRKMGPSPGVGQGHGGAQDALAATSHIRVYGQVLIHAVRSTRRNSAIAVTVAGDGRRQLRLLEASSQHLEETRVAGRQQ